MSMGFKEKKIEINEYVRTHGVGAHVNVKGIRKDGKNNYEKDKDGKRLVIIDDEEVYRAVLLKLIVIQDELVYYAFDKFKNPSWELFTRLQPDFDNVFLEKVNIITASYNPEKGMSFVNYFLDTLYKEFKYILRDTKINLEEIVSLDEMTDGDKEEKKKIILKTVEIDDPTGRALTDPESRMIYLTNLIKFVCAQKKNNTKIGIRDRMYRICYTEIIICWVEDADKKYFSESRHSCEVYENADRALLRYLMVKNVAKLKDIIDNSFKTIPCIRDLIDEVTSNEEFSSTYKMKFDNKGIREKEADIPKIPFHTALIEAYLYYGDCRNMDETGETPKMQSDSYVDKYRNIFRKYVDQYDRSIKEGL